MPTFYVLSGNDLGKTYAVGEGALFGRTPECEVVLRGGGVSRRHARLEREDEDWVLVDLGSRNGTHCEGRRRERLELRDGLLFELGQVELRVRLEAAGEAPPPATPERAPTPVEREPAPEVSPSAEVEEPEPELDLGDEIELEGEELLDAPPPRPIAGPARSAPPAPAAPRAAPPGAAASAPRAGGVDVRDAGRQVLQFSKHHQERGFFSSDLAQYPAWVRLLAAILALALFVGVAYLAFRGTGALKERAVGGVEVEEEL